jgi:predicted Zn-dependent protease
MEGRFSFNPVNTLGEWVEMTEETKQAEMVENEQPEAKKTGMVEIDAAELEQIRAALKKANGEAAKYRKAQEQLEADQKAKAEAEMTELDKANKRTAELEARLKQIERENVQREIAAKVGLPAKLASRLQGETPEEMEADAKAILEDLPKPAQQQPLLDKTKPSPGIVPANPGGNGRAGGKSDMERLRELGLL